MGGLNEADRLKAKGFDAKKGTRTRPWIGDFTVIETGPLAHPRWSLPIDLELRAYILAHGLPGTFEARESNILEIIDGARRLKAGLDVERELQRTKPRQLPLVWSKDDDADPGRLYVDVDLVHCDDAELLLRRLAANRGGLPDSISVLAAIVVGLAKVGHEDVKSIVAVMPRGIGPAEVSALARYDGLVKALRPRFDSGEFPIGILGAVLDAARDEQIATAEKLKANGIKTAKGATRHTNGAKDKRDPWARRMNPRTLVKSAQAICVRGSDTDIIETACNKSDRGVTTVLAAIAIGYRLAANHDTRAILKALPDPIAKAIREARASKAGAK